MRSNQIRKSGAPKREAAVIGSGPNGLAAAIVLARQGIRVRVYEAAPVAGGGVRSAELTLPGFLHDTCSAVYPLGVCSPCFEQFPLKEHGVTWIQPDAPLAHPLDDGTAVILEQSVERTAGQLGEDADAWRRLFAPLASFWPTLRHEILRPIGLPRHPWAMSQFGLPAIASARGVAERRFRGTRARALFAGIAAHSVLPLEERLSAGIALVLSLAAMTTGWPILQGGAQSLAAALTAYLESLGGEVVTGTPVETLPDAPLVMCDVGPRQLLKLGGSRFPASFRQALAGFRYGPGVFKLDWALDTPIPWRARECYRAATVHLGGTLEEIAAWERRHTGKPFVLLVQPTLFDSTRAPEGKHTAWAYCHVPNGSTKDMTDAIEDQIERFAPGFRSRILGRHVLSPAALEQHNPNLVGGDVGGGRNGLPQSIFRPTWRRYGTPLEGVYLCSSSTPPGGGVHGMCGYHAARQALRSL
ncbi:MAG: NAD(P)/FAD-dependent oxidoreductase [Acidobacteriia bacterium]|nr:NAD(P)/FAD-dependent oxidoreductase [Terriglobia bacterium]